MVKIFDNIGITQGRMVPSEKKNRIQYFPIKNWKKEMRLMKKNKIQILEWTINFEKINQNPLLDKNKLEEIITLKEKLKIKIPSVTCDFFMEQPFFKKKNTLTLKYLKKIIKNGKKIGVKFFVLPLVDKSSIKSAKQEKEIIIKLKKFKNYLDNDQKILFEIDYEPKKVKKFISNFDKKFGINYDSGNSASKGYLIQNEKIYFNKVYNIHIKDRVLNGKTVRLGNGDCNFKALFTYLKNIKYKRNLILQTARSKTKHILEVNRNIDFIKKLL